MGTTILLVALELATFAQLVLIPTVTLLVCAWSVQPVWSSGHESVRLPPEAENVMLVGLALTGFATESVTKILVDPVALVTINSN